MLSSLWHITVATEKPMSLWEGSDGERVSLWGGAAPLGSGKTPSIHPNITATGRPDAFLTIFRPNITATGNGTTIIIVPGGAYRPMSHGWAKGAEGAAIARHLATVGITGIVLGYRLPRGRPQLPLMDALQAVSTVRRNARRGVWSDLHPRRIGILGFSAGGHLAALAATLFSSPAERVDFVMLMYPVISMRTPYTHDITRREMLGRHPSVELVNRFSAELHVSHRTPPTFLSHALDDPLVDPRNSLLFYNACKVHRVPCKYLPIPVGGHPFVTKPDAWLPCRAAALMWLGTLNL